MEESHAHPERRSLPRFAVDEDATLVMVSAGATISGRMFEISLDGCRVRTAGRHPVAAPALIEIIFKVNGIAFRLGGVIEWIEHEQVVGIRFGAMALRRRETLEDLLAELDAEEQARTAAQVSANETAALPKEAAGPAASANGCVEPAPGKTPAEPSAAERRRIEPAESAAPANESIPAAQPAPRAAPSFKTRAAPGSTPHGGHAGHGVFNRCARADLRANSGREHERVPHPDRRALSRRNLPARGGGIQG